MNIRDLEIEYENRMDRLYSDPDEKIIDCCFKEDFGDRYEELQQYRKW